MVPESTPLAVLPDRSLPMRCTFVLLVAAGLAAPSRAQIELEPFGPAGFTNPFFDHAFEYEPQPNWLIENLGGDWVLHLQPNTDVITWVLPPGKALRTFRCEITDFETEPFGPGGTSSVLVYSSDGDFARYNTVQLAVPELATFTSDTPGILTGEPLGEIVSVQLQASNTGGAGGVGALFDDIGVELVDTAFTELGGGLAGANGVPRLLGWGDVSAAGDFSVKVHDALEDAPAIVVLGASQLDLPFAGGTLVPFPDLLLPGPATGPSGSLVQSFVWPVNPPPGTQLWWQVWVLDDAAPFGLAASNALLSVSS